MAQTASTNVKQPLAVGRNFLSSIVVSLVALPLCLGIALTCGLPPSLGILTGIVGGIVVGTLAGAPLQVSGPTAGSAVLVFELVEEHGLVALGPVVIMAGLMQVGAGLVKVGRWFRAVSPAVVYGMLSGIGLLIILSQLHVMLDRAPRGAGLANILELPASIAALFGDTADQHKWALAIGIQTLLTLGIWKTLKLDKRIHVPAALPATGGAVLLAVLCHAPVRYIDVPADFISSLELTRPGAFELLFNHQIALAAVGLALVATTETLLCANAIDQLHAGPRARSDKELVAQGVGNVVAGTLGGLPLAGVIARSTVNIEAGGTNRLSTILHGVWLLAVMVLAPFALKYIPTASLAALLVFTGFKLIDFNVIRKLRSFNSRELPIYLATVVCVVATDLLTGVLVGLVLALACLVYTISKMKIFVRHDEAEGEYVMTLSGSATFLGLPNLSDAIAQIPAGAKVRVVCARLVFVDHACYELLSQFESRHKAGGGSITIDWSRVSLLKCPTKAVSRDSE